jgi:hypothetical protein
MGNKTMIALAGSSWTKGSKRATERAKVFYITGISWGSGSQIVKTFTYSADKAKALKLRTKTALKVAAYLHRSGKSPFVTA